ncbi:uncharacterized protein PG986_013589 [Apiospora aurea]|uniref:Uncharacterized protein n=1 Tax=Apiospora aurea TaxID=335848 RepID=A0ABR1PVZ2_9PEZI
MAKTSKRELESLGIVVDASEQPTPGHLAHSNIPVPDHHQDNAVPAPAPFVPQAPAVMDGVEGSETSEDYTADEDVEMTEDGESSEENGNEDELECTAAGDAHLFTALSEPPMNSTGKERTDKVRVTKYLQKLGTLMSSGYMGIHSQIDNSPAQTYMDSLTQLMRQDGRPGTRSEIFGPEHLRAFHWNITRNHLTPLSYAMNHFVSVDLPDQADDCHMASLKIAFHLIRKGADPRRVDPEVRRKVLAEYQRRAAADLPPQPKQQLLRAFCRDNMAGMAVRHFCENSGELAYMPPPTSSLTIPTYFRLVGSGLGRRQGKVIMNQCIPDNAN